MFEENGLKINIIPKESEVNSSEKQIIRVAVLNILALLNAIVTQKGMVSNPIENQPENLGYEVHFEVELTDEEKNEFIRRTTNQVETFLLMAEVPYKIEMDM